jgi:hypothetical protein
MEPATKAEVHADDGWDVGVADAPSSSMKSTGHRVAAAAAELLGD